MSNEFAMVTRCDSKAKELAEVTHSLLECFAEDWGCDFIVLGDELGDTGDYEKNHYRILEVHNLLKKYRRIVIVDSDVIIMPGTPNPFEIVPATHIGTIYEDVGSRKPHRSMVIKEIQEKYGDIGWEEGYINTGFFIVSAMHKEIFDDLYIPRWEGFGYDDAFIGYLIKKLKFPVYELSYKWNHMQMFSEPWNDNANRFDSYVIHYAGAARFPDDKSGRTDLTNALSGRIELIKSDMDRITDGLMTFKDAKPTKKQGHGSVTYECKYGIQEMDVILKVSNTEECFLREKENQGKGIPNAVRIFGTANDPQVGHFIMLEKLHPLPDEIDDILILKIASKTLETLRYCYLNDITWIPKLDHIMLNGDGEVRIIDFGDDPYEKIPFFGDEEAGIEGILMDGECDKDGNYTMRYTYPLSGFRAIMQYLIDKHSDGRLSLRLGGIEYSMIAREYQSLKDVHQPINYAGLNGTFRTETEPADPDFGKLVPANRACVDRAAMLTPHLPSSGRWLDIGCNVGWFQFEFCNILEMVGVERDKEKVRFAQMIYDLYYSGKQNVKHVDFHEGLVDLKYVDNMPSYDIISAFSVLHLKLVADKDKEEFWILLEGICSKVKDLFFFEFPPHSYALAGVANTDQFIENVQLIGKFRKVEQIGKTDAGRPMLKCQK